MIKQSIMARLNPYLNVPGKCREMMEFYAASLDASLTLQTVADSPVASQLPAEYQQQVIHSVLEKGDLILMASDMSKHGSIVGNNVQLCVNCTSEEEINIYFNRLCVGGEINEPLQVMFWGGYFGALTDRYGIHWMFNFEPGK
jgi:PhnB protein